MEDKETLIIRLQELRLEHRDLDAAIDALQDTVRYDQLQMQRLKKKKLFLRDEIARIQDQIYPDIIA
ncbi:MAG: YdcH family protein [Pseudomonadota bacterium]